MYSSIEIAKKQYRQWWLCLAQYRILKLAESFLDVDLLAVAKPSYVSQGNQSKKISDDQEVIQSDPTSCPKNQKGNN